MLSSPFMWNNVWLYVERRIDQRKTLRIVTWLLLGPTAQGSKMNIKLLWSVKRSKPSSVDASQ